MSARRVKKSRATSAAVRPQRLYGASPREVSAEIVAEALQVDLFRVDVPAVVSQYIGETEKNLNVFYKTEASGAIFFFDQQTRYSGRGAQFTMPMTGLIVRLRRFKGSRRLPVKPHSVFLTSICEPCSDYRAKNNTTHIQYMPVPAIRANVEVRVRNLDQDEAQETYCSG